MQRVLEARSYVLQRRALSYLKPGCRDRFWRSGSVPRGRLTLYLAFIISVYRERKRNPKVFPRVSKVLQPPSPKKRNFRSSRRKWFIFGATNSSTRFTDFQRDRREIVLSLISLITERSTFLCELKESEFFDKIVERQVQLSIILSTRFGFSAW